jgi:hypothetical protein
VINHICLFLCKNCDKGYFSTFYVDDIDRHFPMAFAVKMAKDMYNEICPHCKEPLTLTECTGWDSNVFGSTMY